jgi:hypothetical protein
MNCEPGLREAVERDALRQRLGVAFPHWTFSDDAVGCEIWILVGAVDEGPAPGKDPTEIRCLVLVRDASLGGAWQRYGRIVRVTGLTSFYEMLATELRLASLSPTSTLPN